MTDPKIAFLCFFGPCTPYQYRLTGPGKWSGAREAILTQWQRTLMSLKTRPLGFEPNPAGFSKTYIIFVVVIAIIMYYIFLRQNKQIWTTYSSYDIESVKYCFQLEIQTYQICINTYMQFLYGDKYCYKHYEAKV